MRVSLPTLSFMVRTSLAAAAALAATGSSAAPPDHESWRCNVPYGQFDALNAGIWDKTTTVTGELIFKNANSGPRWASTAAVGFTDSARDADGCQCNGLRIEARDEKPGKLLLIMTVDGEERAVGWYGAGQPLRFKLTFNDAAGTVKLEAAGMQMTASPASMVRNQMHLSCSSAAVSFRNLDPE